MSSIDDYRCLLLNADYSPLCLVSKHKTVVWVFKIQAHYICNVEILQYFTDKYIIGADGKKYFLPMLARLTNFVNIHNKKIKFSRHNVFLRDNYTCQYCGTKLSLNQLTYDHVIPRSKIRNQRKATHWNNIVTCCLKCNFKKGDRTPDQANMSLISSPSEPTDKIRYLPINRELSMIKQRIPEEWQPFINTKFL